MMAVIPRVGGVGARGHAGTSEEVLAGETGVPWSQKPQEGSKMTPQAQVAEMGNRTQ